MEGVSTSLSNTSGSGVGEVGQEWLDVPNPEGPQTGTGMLFSGSEGWVVIYTLSSGNRALLLCQALS